MSKNLPKQIADAAEAAADSALDGVRDAGGFLGKPYPEYRYHKGFLAGVTWLWTHLLEAAPDAKAREWTVAELPAWSTTDAPSDTKEVAVVERSAYDQLAAQVVALQHELKMAHGRVDEISALKAEVARERQAADSLRSMCGGQC